MFFRIYRKNLFLFIKGQPYNLFDSQIEKAHDRDFFTHMARTRHKGTIGFPVGFVSEIYFTGRICMQHSEIYFTSRICMQHSEIYSVPLISDNVRPLPYSLNKIVIRTQPYNLNKIVIRPLPYNLKLHIFYKFPKLIVSVHSNKNADL